MRRNVVLAYWLMLCLGHFLVDMVGGLLSPALPQIMAHFGTLYFGSTALLMFFSIGANGGQIIFGEIGDRSLWVRRVVWLAPVVACVPLFVGFVGSYAVLCVLLVIGGTAVALYHPISLHEVSSLPRLPSGAVVSVFLAMGFCGYASGSLVGALIAEKAGLRWLWTPIVPAAAAAVVLLWGMHAFQGAQRRAEAAEPTPPRPVMRAHGYSFPFVWGAALLVAFSSSTLVRLMPTYIYELRGTTIPGGAATMAFGLCGAVGGVVFGTLSERFRRGYVCAVALALASVFLAVFFFGGGWLAAFSAAGLGIGSAFPVLVAMSHEARGRRSHRRDALMVGGAWGIAALMLLPVGEAADRWGLVNVLPWVVAIPPLAVLAAVALELVRTKENGSDADTR